MPRRYLTGGGKDLKNRCKSCSYFFKIFNLVKFYIKKLLSENKPSDRRTEKNTGSSVTLVNEKLRFAAYERRASAGILGKNQLQLAEKHNPLGEKYRVQRHAGCRTVSGEITKVVSDAQGKPLDRRTEKNTESSVTLVNEKLRFGAYDRIGGVGARAAQIDYSQNPSSIVLRNKRSFRTANRGAILIEFAICMPILIILLFYVHDLVKIKRYYSQTEFVAQQFVNVIQNISQKREDKTITFSDLKYACCLAYLTMYPGYSRFWRGYGRELIHGAEMYVTYAEGESGGTASSKWTACIYTSSGSENDSAEHTGLFVVPDHGYTRARGNLTKVTPTAIHPLLTKIEPGQSKIIVECVMHYPLVFADINGYQPKSPRKAFGCFFADIKSVTNSDAFFHSAVIFTPKPGLFSSNSPPTN